MAQGRTTADALDIALDIARDVARMLIANATRRPALPTASERRDFTIVVAA